MDPAAAGANAELQARAREFATQHLFPYELECELNDGLPQETLEEIRRAVLDFELNAINHSVSDGGRGLDLFQQVLVQEELGKATGAL